uniref:Putative secreted protein n=1 Tax=Rhipicephalus microplus TaxID=6941 RepID=A0A6M2DBP8_RHIMP
MKSTSALTAREATAAVVVAACVLGVSLSTASGQDVGRCDPSSVTQCYMMYMTMLWAEDYRPSHEYDEEQLKRGCSASEEKLPCHRYLVNCSEAVTGDHSIEERGYEALCDIMCDFKTLKGGYI